MAVKVTLTQEDILRGIVLNNAWYHLKIKDVTTETAKAGDSTNYVISATVQGGPKQKDGSSPVGVPIRIQYNEKALGFTTKYIQAFLTPGEKVAAGKVYDLESSKGKEVEAYIETKIYNNVPYNNAVDFRPVAHTTNA